MPLLLYFSIMKPQRRQQNQIHLYIKIRGMKYEDCRQLKGNLNKPQVFCVQCKKSVCYKHRNIDETKAVKCVHNLDTIIFIECIGLVLFKQQVKVKLRNKVLIILFRKDGALEVLQIAIIFIPLFHLPQLYLCLGLKSIALNMDELCYRYNFQTISINSESVTQLVG